MARTTLDFRLPAGITKQAVLGKIDERVQTVRRLSPDAQFNVKVLHETEPHLSDKLQMQPTMVAAARTAVALAGVGSEASR